MVKRAVTQWAESDAIKLFARIGLGALSVVMPALIAVSLWVGNTVWEMHTELTVLAERVGAKHDLYSLSDAQRDFARRDEKDRQQDQLIAEARAAINENRNRVLELLQQKRDRL